MIPVFICIDDNLKDKWYNCYNSIIRNTKEKIQFYVICLSKEYSIIPQGDITFINWQTDLQINLNDTFVRSPAMYLRFYISHILPDIDKIIYTECDSVYNCDIAEHYNIDIGDNLIACVSDWFSKTCGKLKRWSGNINGFDDLPAYLSGNMIMNLKAWRENKIAGKLINIVRENNIRVNLATSIVCKDKIKELPIKYCLPASHKDLQGQDGIFHWSGNSKPWNIKCRNQEIFDKYN